MACYPAVRGLQVGYKSHRRYISEIGHIEDLASLPKGVPPLANSAKSSMCAMHLYIAYVTYNRLITHLQQDSRPLSALASRPLSPAICPVPVLSPPNIPEG